MKQITGYQIIDNQSATAIGKPYTEDKGRNARAKAEKMNQSYGAVRYTVQMIWSN